MIPKIERTPKEKLRRVLAQGIRRVAGYIEPLPTLRHIAIRECPCCGYVGPFRPGGGGDVVGYDVTCENCLSMERHRFLKIYFDRAKPVAEGARTLHFAAEPSVTRFLEPLSSGRYVRADIDPTLGDMVVNIEAMQFEDDSFDCIVCGHVLEHVDDTKALAEIFRVLAPGGTAFLMIPIVEGWEHTYENPEVTTEFDRLKHFGQRDHVRRFGRDFRDRVRAAGFTLDEVTTEPADCVRYSLLPGERIFLASKPAA
ncbi:MAG: class I SAM-dependent methyltransferase [Pseudomonadota bacterium]